MYRILFKNEVCGSAEIEERGLYYHIKCSCRMVSEKPCRIYLLHNGGSTDLGTCIRKGKCYCLEKRIPIKCLSVDAVTFVLEVSGEQSLPRFVPLESGKPFPYLASLEKGRMAILDGRVGVAFTDSSQVRLDSDQSP